MAKRLTLQDYQNLLNRVSKEEFINFYSEHNYIDTCKYFDLTDAKIRFLCAEFGFTKDKEAFRKAQQKKKLAEKHQKWIVNLTSRISKDELLKYIQSHNRIDTCRHFDISDSALTFLINYWDLPKQRNKSKYRELTLINKHGSLNGAYQKINDKRKNTCRDKYGVDFAFQSSEMREKSKNTCLEKYGVEHHTQSDDWKKRFTQAKIDHFGTLQNCYEHVVAKGKETRIKNSGNLATSYHEALQKQSQTIQERYGVPYACMRPEARNFTNNSKPNLQFAQSLQNLNIDFEREFPIDAKSFDFKVDNTLVEINPYATHNSTWGLFGPGIDKNYHINKSKLAFSHGYNCIHIWDWDNIDKVLNLVTNTKNKIFGRKCLIKHLDKSTCADFLNSYHLQNTCRGQIVRLGLYYNDNLIQVMTFGKPRYNKKYEWELLRLCTHPNFFVVGGAEKLFKHFITNYNPESIISYCDNSKFKGDVYKKLGFELVNFGKPSLHWVSSKDKNIHITDNLLRQRGFDQLFGTNYGKGTSNRELMLNNKFVEIYDCGQSTYCYKKEI